MNSNDLAERECKNTFEKLWQSDCFNHYDFNKHNKTQCGKFALACFVRGFELGKKEGYKEGLWKGAKIVNSLGSEKML